MTLIQKENCTSGNVTAHSQPLPPSPPRPPPSPPTPGPPPSPPTTGMRFYQPLFSDGMILQSDRPAKIWGLGAMADSTVTFAVSDSHGLLVRATTKANHAGAWNVSIRMGHHNSTTLVAIDSSGASASLRDVAWGAVLLCGGQS